MDVDRPDGKSIRHLAWTESSLDRERSDALYSAGVACFDLTEPHKCSLPTVQALHLRGTYILNSDGACWLCESCLRQAIMARRTFGHC